MLYNANLTNLNNVTGDQIGAYFGYSLASCDVNGDGLDDLLIGENLQIAIMMMNWTTGSPMWTDYSVMDRFETGRVYVVYQDKQVKSRVIRITQPNATNNFSKIIETLVSENNNLCCSAPLPELWHVDRRDTQSSVRHLCGQPRRHQPWRLPR